MTRKLDKNIHIEEISFIIILLDNVWITVS